MTLLTLEIMIIQVHSRQYACPIYLKENHNAKETKEG